MNNSQPKEVKMPVKFRQEIFEGTYANLAMVHHTPEEFIIDFFLANPPQYITLNSRIILNPGHIKRLWKVLGENISKYENKFGKIKETSELKVNIDMKKSGIA